MPITSLATANLQVTRITGSEELAAMADSWNRLAGSVPFRRWEWLEAWWRHYGRRNDRLMVLAVSDLYGRLVGLAPLYVRTSRSQGRLVRFLGSGKVCSDYLTVLSDIRYSEAVGRRVADWLSREAGRQWDLIELEGVDRSDPAVHSLVEALAALGHTVHQRQLVNTWRIEFPDNWPQFVARLSTPRRRLVRKLERDLATGRAVLHTVDEREDLDRGLAILVDLHQRRRESVGQVGCFASSQFTQFHREVVRRFFLLGRLRLQWTELEGRPVAAQYALVGGETVYDYQSGMDPDLAAHHPGWLQLTASLQSALEAGYRSFDFLRGDEAYKASLRAEPRPLSEIRIVAHHASARLRHGAWSAGVNLKSWVRQGMRVAQRFRRPGGSKVPAAA